MHDLYVIYICNSCKWIRKCKDFQQRTTRAFLHSQQDLRLPSVTTIAIPDGYDWREMLTYITKHHQMEMTGGLGPSVGMVSWCSLICASVILFLITSKIIKAESFVFFLKKK